MAMLNYQRVRVTPLPHFKTPPGTLRAASPVLSGRGFGHMEDATWEVITQKSEAWGWNTYHLVIYHSHETSPFLIGKPSINGPSIPWLC